MNELNLDNIIGWQKNSFNDFPRAVSTVLFFSGCNLRCPYCHNSRIVLNELPPIVANELWAFLVERKTLIDGVALTGGEPTIHSNLIELAAKIKRFGYAVKLDTNGLLPEKVEAVIPHIDYLAIDVKTSPELYKSKLKSSFDDNKERLSQTINLAMLSKLQFEIRTTAVRGLIDNDICHEIGAIVKGSSQMYLQSMNPGVKTLDSTYSTLKPFSKEELEQFRRILLKYVDRCDIR